MSKKVYYKVVSSKDNLLVSVTGNLRNVTYIPNKFVYPERSGTYLFVFDTLDNARKAVKDFVWKSQIIWECECQGVETPNSENSQWCTKSYDELPSGTMFAYGVKLTKEIESPKPKKQITLLEEGTRFSIDGYKNIRLVRVSTKDYQLIAYDKYNRYCDKFIEERTYKVDGFTHTGVLLSDVKSVTTGGTGVVVVEEAKSQIIEVEE